MNMMRAPCAMKVARTVLGGGKVGDDVKDLPIAIKFDPATGKYVDFDSITMRLVIKRGGFEKLIQRMCNASVAECKSLAY